MHTLDTCIQFVYSIQYTVYCIPHKAAYFGYLPSTLLYHFYPIPATTVLIVYIVLWLLFLLDTYWKSTWRAPDPSLYENQLLPVTTGVVSTLHSATCQVPGGRLRTSTNHRPATTTDIRVRERQQLPTRCQQLKPTATTIPVYYMLYILYTYSTHTLHTLHTRFVRVR